MKSIEIDGMRNNMESIVFNKIKSKVKLRMCQSKFLLT
jgi:hypothetical protein